MCVGVCKRMYGKAHVWRLDLPEGLVKPPLGLGSLTLFETEFLFLLFSAASICQAS